MLEFTEFTAVTTLGDLLLRAARENPDRCAIAFPDERRSFAELAEGAILHARALYAQGVRPGEHVGFLLPSSIESLEVFFGIALLGAVAVPVNARYRAQELRYLVQDADLVALVTSTQVADKVNFVDRLTEAFPALDRHGTGPLKLTDAPRLRAIALVADGAAPGFVPRVEFLAGASGVEADLIHALRRRVLVRDTALILYTSGTTSSPKGCLIAHEALVRTGQALATRYEMTGADVFWSPLPMYHIAAMFPICAAYAVGATYLSMRHFDAGTALRQIEAEGATLTYPSFGTFIADMIYHPDYPNRDMSSVRLMNSNLAMQPDSFRAALRERMPGAVQVGTYGMTETSGTVTTSFITDDYEQRTCRLGKPFDGLEVRTLCKDGTEAGPDEIGEIVVRGFSVFSGYYKDAEKTRAAFQDGWFHTGDLGSLDAAGSMMFHGRLKDMLKVGGENVAALEIEALVAQHDAVMLCQVVGRPDPRLMEVPVAFVQLKPGAVLTGDEVIAFCRSRISGFKVPREVHFVREWPMSASKIQKFKLKEMLGL